MRTCPQAQAHMRRSLLADVEVPLSSPTQPEGEYSSTEPLTPEPDTLCPGARSMGHLLSAVLRGFATFLMRVLTVVCTALHCIGMR
jgi:hypothetical protein